MDFLEGTFLAEPAGLILSIVMICVWVFFFFSKHDEKWVKILVTIFVLSMFAYMTAFSQSEITLRDYESIENHKNCISPNTNVKAKIKKYLNEQDQKINSIEAHSIFMEIEKCEEENEQKRNEQIEDMVSNKLKRVKNKLLQI